MRNKMKRFLPRMGTILITLVIIVGLNMLFGSVAAFGQSTLKPQIKTNTDTGLNTSFNSTVQARVIETHTVQYVEKPVTVVEYVDRVQKVSLVLDCENKRNVVDGDFTPHPNPLPQGERGLNYYAKQFNLILELRNFKDLEELKQWLKDVNTNTATIFFERPGTSIDCDDFAIALQRRALGDGYLMSFQIIEPGKYNSLFERAKIPLNTLHAINLAIIDNNVYYIEPQTGEVVLAAGLD